MDSLNFFIHLNFICDILRYVFSSKPKDVEDEVEKAPTEIEEAIDYFKQGPENLVKVIMSSDISMETITSPEVNITEHRNMLRLATGVLRKKGKATGYIDANKNELYLKSFILSGLEVDVSTAFESFFNQARAFLEEYKELDRKDINNRLYSSVSSNLIVMKRVFLGMEYRELDD